MSLDFTKNDDGDVNDEQNAPETAAEQFQERRAVDPHAEPPYEDLRQEYDQDGDAEQNPGAVEDELTVSEDRTAN